MLKEKEVGTREEKINKGEKKEVVEEEEQQKEKKNEEDRAGCSLCVL